MKSWLKWSLPTLVVGVYVGCSPKQFSKDPEFKACQDSSIPCVQQNGRDYFDYNETVEGGKVDILVVTDNSASMSTEQNQLANKFNNFILNLDNKKINYRLGVITTDISDANNPPRQVNGNGALQDGKLVTFSGGQKYLTRDSGTLAQKDTMFKNAVRRAETLSCEQFIINWKNAGKSMASADYSNGYFANCPSGDERGIYAARLTMENNPESFIRSEANLAVIILSDEDVRSQLYYYNEPGFSLDDKDTAQGFVNMMTSKYPTKQYGVHSIITKDPTCLATQNSQTLGLVNGSYGLEYANLSNLTGGIGGDICASDYTTQLLSIFNNIQSQILDKVALACANPTDLTVTLVNNSDPSITWTVTGKELKFSKKLPVGTTVNVKYSCETL